jgi:hypothetical protein
MAIEDLPGYPGLVTLIESYINKINDAQDSYFIDYGKYFQGVDLISDSEPNGVIPVQADTNKKPEGDQDHSWFDFDKTVFAASMALPTNIKINIYESDDKVNNTFGWGYVITFEFWRDGLGPDILGTSGRHWYFRHHRGPATPSGIFDQWLILFEGDA